MAKWFFGDQDDGVVRGRDGDGGFCVVSTIEEDACSSLYNNGDLLIETVSRLSGFLDSLEEVKGRMKSKNKKQQ